MLLELGVPVRLEETVEAGVPVEEAEAVVEAVDDGEAPLDSVALDEGVLLGVAVAVAEGVGPDGASATPAQRVLAPPHGAAMKVTAFVEGLKDTMPSAVLRYRIGELPTIAPARPRTE